MSKLKRVVYVCMPVYPKPVQWWWELKDIIWKGIEGLLIKWQTKWIELKKKQEKHEKNINTTNFNDHFRRKMNYWYISWNQLEMSSCVVCANFSNYDTHLHFRNIITELYKIQNVCSRTEIIMKQKFLRQKLIVDN